MDNFVNILLGIPVAYAQAGEKAPEATDIVSYVLQKLPFWITAVVVFVTFLLIAVILKKIVEGKLSRNISEEHQEVLIISGRVTFLAVAVIGTTISLSIAGIDLTALLAAIAFGVSFGMQDTISNFVAGLALLASRPFTIGDWIKVEGQTGKVIDIRTRATYLQTPEGMRLVVPNSTLYSSSVLSMTSNPLRRLAVPIYCRYGANLKEVTEIAMNVVKSEPRIFLEPKPYVVLVDFADYYVNLEVRFWVDAKSLKMRIRSEVGLMIQERLEACGFDAPYPITNVSAYEDGEETVIKTKVVDPAEFEKMKADRAELQKEFDTAKAQYAKEQVKETQEKAYIDQTGMAFIQQTMGPATPPTATEPVLPPSVTQTGAPEEKNGPEVLNQPPAKP